MVAYYISPIGTIRIKSNGEYIEEVRFLNLDDGEKIHENDNFEADPVPVIKKCLQQLDEYFKGTRKVFDLPLTQAGTDFQKKVWNELIHIPYGKTTSYLLFSKSLGNIKAIRAVGSANGKNKI